MIRKGRRTGLTLLLSSWIGFAGLAGCSKAQQGALIGGGLGAGAGFLIGHAIDEHTHYGQGGHGGYGGGHAGGHCPR